MKKSNKVSYRLKDKKFKAVALSKKDQKNIKGGYIFKLLDDLRCNVERSLSFWTGGNGDGDW